MVARDLEQPSLTTLTACLNTILSIPSRFQDTDLIPDLFDSRNNLFA